MGRKSDIKNEGIGIVSIILIVLVAIGGLYYFFSHGSHKNGPKLEQTKAPVEVPAPLIEEDEKK